MSFNFIKTTITAHKISHASQNCENSPPDTVKRQEAISRPPLQQINPWHKATNRKQTPCHHGDTPIKHVFPYLLFSLCSASIACGYQRDFDPKIAEKINVPSLCCLTWKEGKPFIGCCRSELDSHCSLALPGDLCTKEPSSLQGLAQLILPVTSSTTWLHHRGMASVIPGDTILAEWGGEALSITFNKQVVIQ